MKEILIISDFVAKGKISANIMVPVLAYKNYNTYFVPTALISNNFDYGKAAVVETYGFMKESFDIYKSLGFLFDIIFIGYVEDHRQKDLIIEFIQELDNKPLIVFDPIMGDNGKLYKGVSDEKIEIYKDLLDFSDITLPNFTEAKFLELLDYDKLLLDNRKYVITSVNEDDNYYNLGISDHISKAGFDKMPIKVGGTGDLFDAIFLSKYLDEKDFDKAISYGVEKMSQILRLHNENHPDSNDIYIESYLKLLD